MSQYGGYVNPLRSLKSLKNPFKKNEEKQKQKISNLRDEIRELQKMKKLKGRTDEDINMIDEMIAEKEKKVPTLRFNNKVNSRIINNEENTKENNRKTNITNNISNYESENVKLQIAKLKELLLGETITNGDQLKNVNKALTSDSDKIIIKKANNIANNKLEDVEQFQKIQKDQEKYLQELKKLKFLEKFHFSRELNKLIEQAEQMIENMKVVIKRNENEADKILHHLENIRESSVIKGGKRTMKRKKTKRRVTKKGKKRYTRKH